MKNYLFFFVLIIPGPLLAQHQLGFETQAYPAGIVPGLRVDLQITTRAVLTGRIGYNFTNRRDWGRHHNEEGGGPGFSLGYEYKSVFSNNVRLHLRSDLWFLDIDWEKKDPVVCFTDPCNQITINGNSDVIVLQPTLGISYQAGLTDQLFLRPSVSLGYEINIHTEGEAVGEGAIFLVGINLGYQF